MTRRDRPGNCLMHSTSYEFKRGGGFFIRCALEGKFDGYCWHHDPSLEGVERRAKRVVNRAAQRLQLARQP